MAIKFKCSECPKKKWAQKSALTCSGKCRSARQRRLIKEAKEAKDAKGEV